MPSLCPTDLDEFQVQQGFANLDEVPRFLGGKLSGLQKLFESGGLFDEFVLGEAMEVALDGCLFGLHIIRRRASYKASPD
jgi:hypothetical protein